MEVPAAELTSLKSAGLTLFRQAVRRSLCSLSGLTFGSSVLACEQTFISNETGVPVVFRSQLEKLNLKMNGLLENNATLQIRSCLVCRSINVCVALFCSFPFLLQNKIVWSLILSVKVNETSEYAQTLLQMRRTSLHGKQFPGKFAGFYSIPTKTKGLFVPLFVV